MLDEDYASQNTSCGVGACAATGTTSCVSGSVQDSCTPGTPGANDTSCNGVDDDCNAATDEDYASQSTSCGVGACVATGSTSCVSGSVQDSCTPGTPAGSDATCNGVDDDCSGAADEDYASTGTTCERNGCAAAGALQCISGSVVDTCPTSGTCTAEIDCDDTSDNDSDTATDCADVDCAEVEGCRETACGNDVDDNGNGLTDCADPACAGGPPCIPEVCGNSIDDDGDGFIDCSDLGDCETAPACPDVPPIAETVAPALDGTVATRPIDALDFLFEGGDPIQRGVATGTIEEDRVALVTGHVSVRDGGDLAAIRVEVLDHPEFGHTHTDTEGNFHLAVNGGEWLTFEFTAPGYITVERQLRTQWQIGGELPDVVMIPRADQAVTVDVDGTTTEDQVALGPQETDVDGTRRAVLIFPPGVEAQVFDANGGLVNVDSLDVRMTEFTVGSTGPAAMPASLPPTSAYTYAIDLTPDEAEGNKVNGIDTVLSADVPFYVDNFLDFPVGTSVPTGYYDDDNGVWKGIDNGIVLEVVGETAGLAEIDADGDGIAEDPQDLLADLSITDGERERVAQLYEQGASVWRVLLPHLSNYDLNLGAGIACDRDTQSCEGPSPLPPQPPPPPPPDPCNAAPNSVVNCHNLTLAEEVAVPGTPYSLHYISDRQPGRLRERSLTIPLHNEDFAISGATDVTVTFTPALGDAQEFRWTRANTPATWTWTWDGEDAFGRANHGVIPVTVRLAYEFECEYSASARFNGYGGASLDVMGSQTYSPREDCRVGLVRTVERTVESWDYREQGLGGWSLSDHHAFNPDNNEVLYGDGSRGIGRQTVATEVAAQSTGRTINFAIAPDLTIYATVEQGPSRGIRRWLPGGTQQTWRSGSVCETAQATSNILCTPDSIAIAPDGSIYVADRSDVGTSDVVIRVVRIDASGQLLRVAGGLGGQTSGDGGPALDARFQNICDLEVGADGSVYVLDCVHGVVRRIGTDGFIESIAGSGGLRPSGSAITLEADDARTVQLSPRGIGLDPNGGFYIVEGANAFQAHAAPVRHVDASGRMTTLFLQTHQQPPGGNLSGARFNDVAVNGRGDLVFTGDYKEVWLLRRTTPLAFQHIAGTGTGSNNCSATGAFPARRGLGDLLHVEFGADGQLYIQEGCSDSFGNPYERVLRMRVNSRGEYGTTLVASPGRDEVYEFDASGRHIHTLHPLTAAVLRTFEYDDGLLVAVVDADGNRTEIERETDGSGAVITAPFGQATVLEFDANGYLHVLTPDPRARAVHVRVRRRRADDPASGSARQPPHLHV